MKKLIFQTGGPFHPVAAQAKVIQSWIPNDWILEPAFGADAFEKLTDADLYVAAGLHWTGIGRYILAYRFCPRATNLGQRSDRKASVHSSDRPAKI